MGADMAFVEDGWAYHTSNDDTSRLKLRPGSVQRCGENVLSLTKELSKRVLLEGRSNDDRVTFFDVCGYFMFVVPVSWVQVVCLISFVLLIFWCHETRVSILHSVSHFIRRSFYTLAAPIVVSLFLVLSPLRWYANPWLVLPLFVAPSLAGALISVEDELKDWTGFIMFFTLLSLLTCYFELGFSYLPVLWIISCLLPRLIFLRSSSTSTTTCLVVLLGSALPVLMTSQLLFFVRECWRILYSLMSRHTLEHRPLIFSYH